MTGLDWTGLGGMSKEAVEEGGSTGVCTAAGGRYVPSTPYGVEVRY